MTDQETILNCNKWELDAILEGLYYKQIEEREALSGLALELRYTLNAKKSMRRNSVKRETRTKSEGFFIQTKRKKSKTKTILWHCLKKQVRCLQIEISNRRRWMYEF